MNATQLLPLLVILCIPTLLIIIAILYTQWSLITVIERSMSRLAGYWHDADREMQVQSQWLRQISCAQEGFAEKYIELSKVLSSIEQKLGASHAQDETSRMLAKEISDYWRKKQDESGGQGGSAFPQEIQTSDGRTLSLVNTF